MSRGIQGHRPAAAVDALATQQNIAAGRVQRRANQCDAIARIRATAKPRRTADRTQTVTSNRISCSQGTTAAAQSDAAATTEDSGTRQHDDRPATDCIGGVALQKDGNSRIAGGIDGATGLENDVPDSLQRQDMRSQSSTYENMLIHVDVTVAGGTTEGT